MPAPIAYMDPELRGQLALKIAKLKTMSKLAFVPSPRTQQQVQAQAQQPGAQPAAQDPNSQAIGASGVTLDEVAQMVDQFYQEMIAMTQQTQQQIVGLQQQINLPEDEKGKDGESRLEARLAQLEQMLGGTGAVAGAAGPPMATPPPGAAPPPGGAVPVPAQPSAPPPPSQQQPPTAGMAPMPGA